MCVCKKTQLFNWSKKWGGPPSPPSNLLTSERLDVEAVCFGREDQEGNDGYVRLVLFQQVVEPGQSLYEDIRAFVTELVTAGREEIKALKWFLIMYYRLTM